MSRPDTISETCPGTLFRMSHFINRFGTNAPSFTAYFINFE